MSPFDNEGDSRPRVFLSSVSRGSEAVALRRLLTEEIERCRCKAVTTERTSGANLPAPQTCRELVQSCDALLSILGWDYGTIHPEESDSYIELEFDAGAGLERRVYMRAGDEPLYSPNEILSQPDLYETLRRHGAFRERARDACTGKLWNTEGELVVEVCHFLSDLTRDRANQRRAATPEAKHSPALDRYRAAARKRHGSLRLIGISEEVPVGDPELARLWVRLDASADHSQSGIQQYLEGETGGREGAGEQGVDRVPLESAFLRAVQLHRRNGLVVIGEPGSGKTTYLQRLLVRVLDGAGEDLGLDRNIIPVLLPLKEFSAHLSEDEALVGEVPLDLFFERVLRDHFKRLPEAFAADLLQRDRLLWLLDGLDEVADQRFRARVLEDFQRLPFDYPESSFVLTTRTAGYRGIPRVGSTFLELRVRELDPEEARTFICNWYRWAVQAEQGPSQAADQLAVQRAEDLIQVLDEAKDEGTWQAKIRVETMARNPLLLSAVCLIHRTQGDLPRRRSDLYDGVISALLQTWKGSLAKDLGLKPDALRGVLRCMALALHRTNTRQGSKESLETNARAYLEGRKLNLRCLPTLVDEIERKGGLLTRRGRVYEFLHLGFQEYLVAEAFLVGQADLQELGRAFPSPFWQEACLLFVARASQEKFEVLFRHVVELPQFPRPAVQERLALVIDEALAPSFVPFLEVLQRDPQASSHWAAAQVASLKFLRGQQVEEWRMHSANLSNHPDPEVRNLAVHQRSIPVEQQAQRGNGVLTLPVAQIPKGAYRRGSVFGFDDEQPVKEVHIDAFDLGVTVVTNEQFSAFLEANPERPLPALWLDRDHNQPNQPVVGVTWRDARAFCEWLGGRLPTEAEWEYACRAGTRTRYWSGDKEEDLARVGWYDRNSEERLHPVAELPANPWGLYDMHGNVWEWCQDWYSSVAYEDSPVRYPKGPKDGAGRVLRGGCFWYFARRCRSAQRNHGHPENHWDFIGFRVAFSPAPSTLGIEP